MQRLKSILTCLLLLCLSVLTLYTLKLLHDADVAARASAAELNRRIEQISRQVFQSSAILSEVAQQIGNTSRDMVKVASSAVDRADAQLSTTNATLAATAQHVGELAETTRETVAAVKPAVEGVTSLAKDAQNSFDDVYPDVKASVESATVAITSTAQASEAIRDAAPTLVQSGVKIEQHVEAVAADFHREVDEVTKPKKWWQKAFGPLYSVGRLVAAFL